MKVITKVIIKEEILFTEMEGESVLINAESGEVYGLDQTGTIILKTIKRNKTFQKCLKELLSIFNISEKEMRKELNAFIEKMEQLNVLEVA